MLDLSPEIEELWEELQAAFHRVMRSGHFIGGPEVEAFEAEVADYLGVKHAVGLNSGTDALVIGLRTLGVGPGDEVITTPFSFFATAESIGIVGATPLFVDVDERTFNMNVELLEASITPRTRAVLPVHLYGRPVEMDALMEVAGRHGLVVLEDCAQSFGARVGGSRLTGTIGHAGAISFYPTKNLGAFGDGGMLVTNDDNVADHARILRNHGARSRYHHEVLGYNSRLDALQAALLRVKLPYVENWNQRRRSVAASYGDLLSDVSGLITPEVSDGHVFHQYTVRVTGTDRDAVQRQLRDAGISTMVYYPVPQDRLAGFAKLPGHCEVSDQLATEVLSLPIGPALTAEAQEITAAALRAAL